MREPDPTRLSSTVPPTDHGPAQHPLLTWSARGALLLWLLAVAAFRETAGPWNVVLDLRSARVAVDSLVSIALWQLFAWASFVPVGFFAVYSWRPRQRCWQRALRVALPAVLLTAAGTAVVGAAAHGWRTPPPVWMVVPLMGGACGIWLGSFWRGGPRTRAWILPTLAAFGVAVIGALAYLAHRVPQPDPLPFELPRVTTAEKKHLTSILRGKDPRRIPEGESRTLRLTETDLNQALALASAFGRGDRAKARVEIFDDGLRLSASAALPATRSLYLNLVAAGRPSVEAGRFRIRVDVFSLGDVSAPSWVLGLASPVVSSSLELDPRLGPVLDAVRVVRLESGALEVEYGRAELPAGFLRDLFQAASRDDELVPAVRAHALHLIQRAPGLPKGEAQFGAALRTVFAFAQERSGAQTAVAENRAAILAFAMLAGHWRVESLVGPVLDEEARRTGRRAFRNTEIRGRRDWVQHYLVSAALAVLSDAGLSESAGLLKEELDSRGGSGFSFGDLLADRAGTSLGEVATRDAGSARALQAHLSRAFRLDDIFPDAEGLPEGIEDSEFQTRYGGVGGERYQSLLGVIDSRLAGCSAYRY